MRSRRIHQATRAKIKKAGKFLTKRSIKVAKVRIAPLTLLLLVFGLPSLLQGYIYWQQRELNRQYSFVEDKESLLGKKSAKLAAYIQEDKEKQAYLFNKESLPSESAPLTNLQQTVQSEDSQTEPLFSAEIGIDKPEVTIHDNQLGVNFSSELLLDTLDGRKDESWVVYPAKDENITVVYSVKNNGIKEDIVIKQATSDEMSFTYKLNLPKSLDAKLLDDGSLGVYSGDPSQYSNMTFGSEADRELIEKVKQNAEKTYLAFVIPKPVIVAENGNAGDAFANFTYDRETQQLTVKGYKLTSIEGVFSIDPTTVITSTADFGSGNDEAGTDFLTSNAISNPTVRGGRIGSWSNANTGGNAGGARVNQATVVYNGYAYIIGGWNGTVAQTRIDYGPINSSGNVTSWTQNGTSLPATRTAHKAVAYNGYMYVIGGCNIYTNYGSPYFNNCSPGTNKNHDAGLGGGWMRSVTYAPINSDGSLGTWTTDTDYFTNAREWHAAGVYNGRLYIAGGRIDSYPGTSNTVNDVQYADILTDGSIGAWTTDGGTSFTTDRMYTEMNIYNGYMYIIGGYNEEGVGDLADVQYAPINEDGSIGTWNSTTSFTTARRSHKTVMHRGYFYLVAGYNGSGLTDVQYAPINTDGTLGAWSDTTAVSSRDNVGVHAWGDYLIWLSGDYSVNYCEKSLIEPNGSIRATGGTWPTTNATTVFRYAAPTVAHNGYIYQVGGATGAGVVQTGTDRASVNSDGTLGTWSTTGGSTLNTARQGHGTVVYNGYIYVVGGVNGSYVPLSKSDAIEYAAINADGTIGTWTRDNTGLMNEERGWTKIIAYKGYMYAFGGENAGGTVLSSVEYAPINSDGTLGTWTATTAFSNNRTSPTVAAYNGYVYIAGGDVFATNTVRSDIQYAAINSDGTIGSWTATTSLPSARTAHTMSISNGVLYVAGGCTTFSSGCTAYSSAVHSAPINTGGTVGTFTANTSFTNSRWGHGMVAYNGYLYIVNGANGGTTYNTVQVARMNTGGVGTTLAWTSATNSLGTATTDHASVTYNGYLYTLGGCTTYTSSNCTAFSSAVQYSAINKGGTLGTSATTTAFTTGRYGHAVAVKDGYLYVLGGCSASTGGTCTNYLSDVQFARINTDGTLAVWQTGTAFTTGRHSHKVVVNGRYIYLSGGDTGTVQSGVQFAALSADGGVSSWTATSNLGTARRDHGLVANNGYLYAVAGHTGSTILSSVEYVIANSDGTLGTWATTTPLTLPLYGHGTGVYNGRIYVSGGCSVGACTTYNNKTHQTEIFGNAHIGAWETSINNFTTARTEAGFAMHNGLIYVTGGCSAGTCTTIQSNISHTGLSVYPYVSEYSRALNLGSGGRSVESFSYGGTGTGTMNVTYRAACTTTTYGSRSLLSYDVSSGERAAFVDVDADYLMVFLTLDAAFNRTFPNASQLQVQDFTVGYTAAHPDASETMRLGNTFIDQIEVGFGTRPEGTSSLGC